MPLVSIICFGLTLILFLSLFKKNTDVFAPARLFIIIWLLSIALTELKFSRYQNDWTLFSWLMLLIAITSFLLGFFIVYTLNIGKPISNIMTLRQYISSNSFNSDILFKYILLLFTAYIISYIISALVIGYIPLFTKYPGVARNDWGIFGFGLFVQSFPSIIYLIYLYFIITRKERNKKLILLVVFLITFLTYAFLLQRYYIAFAIIMIMATMYYFTNMLRFRNVLLITIVGFSIMFGMTFIRLTGTIANYLYYLSDMKFSIKYAFFTEPYMYVVMNLENFSHAVDKIENFAYGLLSFDFIFAISGLKHIVAEYLRLPEFPHLITNNYNTYTMFFVYYWDYGVFGLFLFPLLIGILFTHFYYKMRKAPSLNTVAMYSIFTFVILFSFFVPVMTFLHFVFNTILIYSITRLIEYPQKSSH